MGTNTYANKFEICSKSASGKSLCAFPDPCFTPPVTPAGTEVVIPYPNTAMASDLDKGSAKVLICNKMAALEKDSYLKTSMGNEAAKPSTMQGGVMTKTTKGKAYFIRWSNDVKFEGKGVCRHIDQTTHNHGSPPGHCTPMPFLDGADIPVGCQDLIEKITTSDPGCNATVETASRSKTKKVLKIPDSQCAGLEFLPSDLHLGRNLTEINAQFALSAIEVGEKMRQMSESMEKTAAKNPCLKMLRCVLQKHWTTENTKQDTTKETKLSCCPGQSGHHVIPKSMANAKDVGMPCWPSKGTAPSICVEGVNNEHGSHGRIHDVLDKKFADVKEMNCKELIGMFSGVLKDEFDCDKDCIAAQLEAAKKHDCDSCKHKEKGKPVSTNSGKGGKSSISQP